MKRFNCNKYFLIITVFIFFSCSFLNIDKTDSIRVKNGTLINIKNFPEDNSSVISGILSISSAVIDQIKQKPVVLVACSRISSAEIPKFHYIVIDGTKEFMIYLPSGSYYLYMISDLNNDFLYEDKETIAVFGKPDLISVELNEIKSGFVFEINDTKYAGTDYPDGFLLKYDYNSVEYICTNGQIRKIYSEIFSPDNSNIGWWHPSLFIKAFGANIYMPEVYDPGKIPVLFIHGAQGTPYDFAYFNVRLEKTKYQPMYFFYPSGMRISMLSELLYLKIKELKKKYNFKEIFVVAHSMGGLVSRAMITDYYKDTENFIKLFITFATPWSGFDAAYGALKTSPYVLPSWIDVSAHSMFIKTNLKKRLPESVDYYLFFGKWDKTSKEKALDSRVYTEAKGIFGFNADHNTILSEKEVFEKFIEILNSKYQKK